MKRVGGLLLAAGGSTRMGMKKLLRDVGGRSVLRVSIENIIGSRLCHLCVVVPGWDQGFDRIIEGMKNPRLSFCKLPSPGLMSDSLKAGWQSLAGQIKCDGVMISLADKPLIDEEIVNMLIEEYSAEDTLACVAVHNGEWGHPVILDKKLESDVMNIRGDRGARSILETLPVKQISFGDDRILFDVDCEDDFVELIRRLGSIGRK
ncbi:MAG: nucleotidyltransferase family protein [bacterium]